MRAYRSLAIILVCFYATPGFASEATPYTPAKVVYDVTTPDKKALNHIVDRASLLQNIYGSDPFEASIVFVVHESAIPFFANVNANVNKEFILRAKSLTLGEVIEFRICSASAKMQGFAHEDFPDFVKMVPMADAEIIMLQRQGYAYLR
jgi:intracellular sulfur oxidation DsrE/DsrF family protein